MSWLSATSSACARSSSRGSEVVASSAIPHLVLEKSGTRAWAAPTLHVVQDVLSVPNEVAAELAGVGDGVLDALRARLHCTLRLRGNQLTIEGEEEKVTAARAVVDELVELVEGGHEIGPDTVGAVVAALDQAEDIRSIFDDVVWRHRGKKIAPKTLGQKRYVDAIRDHTVTFGIGPAGTGKTYLAMALAVSALSEREVGRIILTRPAVEAGERLGFLPGDMLAKVDPYLRPLFDALYDMMDAEKLAAYMERGTIEVAPLAFMRGRTLNDSFIILDEAQNTSPEQMQMFLTRLGFGSKVVVTGDMTQVDLPRDQASGLIQVRDILGTIDGIGFIEFYAPGRRAPQARAADRRGVQAARRADGHRAQALRFDGRRRARQPKRRGRRRGGGDAFARRVLAAEGIDAGELGLSFVGPDEMRSLKREHLGLDEPTDVLSFPLDGRDELAGDCRGRSATSCSAHRSWATTGGDRSCTACCTCSATTTARRWSARGEMQRECSAARALDHRELQLRVRRDHPRPPDAAEHAHPLRGRGAVLIAALGRRRKLELIVLMLAIAFVLITEMVNTAVEAAVDVATTSFDPMAKLAKDIAAGAVLIASAVAVAVGYLVFADRSPRQLPAPRPAVERARAS